MIPLLSLEAARLAHLILCPAGRPQPSRPNMILSAHSLQPRQDRFEVGGMVDRSWCHHESRVFCVQSLHTNGGRSWLAGWSMGDLMRRRYLNAYMAVPSVLTKE